MNEKLWNRHYIFILTVNTLNAFSFYMTATILAKYLVNIGITVTMAGFIVGLFSLTSLCCRPFSGIMADRLNNISMLKWSNILMGIGTLGFTITKQVPLLIIFRIINGVGFALSGTCQIAFASRHIPKNKMGEGIGYLGLGMVLGSAVAPGIGLAIAESFSMNVTFISSAALTLIAYLILCFEKDIKQKNSDRKWISLSELISVKAIPYTLVAGSFSFVNGIIASYLVLYAEEIGVKGISIYFTVCAVVLFIIRPVSGKLMDKKGIRVTVLPGLLLTAIAMFMLGRSRTLTMILITGVIRSLGQGTAQPSLQAGCINAVGNEKSGVATSTYYLGSDICQGFGPMIGGAIVGELAGIAGYTALFSTCGILLLCAFVFFFFFSKKKAAIRN